jgi:hypothetical protein
MKWTGVDYHDRIVQIKHEREQAERDLQLRIIIGIALVIAVTMLVFLLTGCAPGITLDTIRACGR